ncbi:DUF5392 family protein [Aquibacillus sediminis]|uniref:DUF5392 family protein n=1 Tax=Aquibacillus sediminis TaxID=2574734 RepID=UPI00110986E5|nr:DUF5392 family protein [Aquibacillus sediminis]
MRFSMKNMQPFVIREMQKLEETVEPLTKKAARFSFWSLPLIIFAIFNLFFLFFVIPDGQMMAMIFYGLIGAIGLAFSKEAKHYQKQILKRSADYMVKRIEQSDVVSASMKEAYIKRIRSHINFQSIHHFIEFLEEENRLQQISYY